MTAGEHRYLSYLLDWYDRPDGAHATFYFENYGNTTCRVSIRRRSDAVNSTASHHGAKLA